MCQRETEIVREVSLSVAKALDECQHQFRDRRWNCSTEQRRVAAKLLKMGLYTLRIEKNEATRVAVKSPNLNRIG